MADREVIVKLIADATQVDQGFKSAIQVATDYESRIITLDQVTQQYISSAQGATSFTSALAQSHAVLSTGTSTTTGTSQALVRELKKEIDVTTQLNASIIKLNQTIEDQGNTTTTGGERLRQFGRRGGEASNFMIQLSRGVEGLKFGWESALNNLDPLIFGFEQWTDSIKKSDNTLTEELLETFTKPAGLLALLNVGVTAAALFGNELVSTFSRGEASASSFKSVLEEVIEIQRNGVTFQIRADDLPEEISRLEKDLESTTGKLDANRIALDNLVKSNASASERSQELASRIIKENKELTTQKEGYTDLLSLLEEQNEAVEKRKNAERLARERGLLVQVTGEQKKFNDELERLLEMDFSNVTLQSDLPQFDILKEAEQDFQRFRLDQIKRNQKIDKETKASMLSFDRLILAESLSLDAKLRKDAKKQQEEEEKEFTKFMLDEIRKRIRAEEDAAQQRIENITIAAQTALTFGSAIGESALQGHDNRLQQIDMERDRRLDALDQQLQRENLSEDERKSLLAQREALEVRFEKRRKEVLRERAKAEKKLALFQATIQAALAVIEALPNPFAVAAAGIASAAQIALIRGQEIPEFRAGVTDFRGGLAFVHQGEVLANLAPGTDVIPASQVNAGITPLLPQVASGGTQRIQVDLNITGQGEMDMDKFVYRFKEKIRVDKLLGKDTSMFLN